MNRYLVVLDTPGIKHYVFGTDSLAEIRGASSILDHMNRFTTMETLQANLELEPVFANGGVAQFIVRAENPSAVHKALDNLFHVYLDKTGGEVRPVAGVAQWPDGSGDYRQAVQTAFAALRQQRDFANGHPSVPTFPVVQECESSSHLPASGHFQWGGERKLLSTSCRLKRDESRQARRGTLWNGWMERLDDQGRFLNAAQLLRYDEAEGIGRHASRQGYVGLVYADGNAMGRLVYELDSPQVYREFSEWVDGSIRDACYEALSEVCSSEIESARVAFDKDETPRRLPADILLLGGDDLLVLLPGSRAIDFARQACDAFERLTRERLDQMPAESKQFFETRGLSDRGLTISCGIAIGPAKYPFYLLLNLAEELLASAKRGGSDDPQREPFWAPSYIDFHFLAGSANQELAVIRQQEYRVDSDRPRTLRPFRSDRLGQLVDAATRLRHARIPRSKLHDLFEAALEPRPPIAQLRAEALLGRLHQDSQQQQRIGLWDALQSVGELNPYPWTMLNGATSTALADLIEVHDLIESSEQL